MNLPFMRRINSLSPYGFLQLFANGDGGGGGATSFTEEQVQTRIKEATGPAVEKAIKDRFGDLAGMDLKDVRAAIELKKKLDEDEKKKKPPEGEEKKTNPVDVDKLLEEKLKEHNAKTFKRLLSSEVKVLANELGFADWEDALALADLSTVKEDDKGNLTGVKEALGELLKKKPHLGKQKPGGGSFGSNVPAGGQEQKKKSQEDIIKLAKSRGTVGNSQTAYDPWAKK